MLQYQDATLTGDEDNSQYAMAVTFGRIEEFDGAKEDWSQYEERLGHFFAANGVESAEKKRSIFLSVVGAATYKLLRSLVAPAKPGDKTYEELVKLLSAHFNPPPSEIVQRFKFHSRVREPGESVATFVSELRSLAEHCNFQSTLEDMLRDRIVCGINDHAIQQRLLGEEKLTFEKAMSTAQAMETAARNAKELRNTPGTAGRPSHSNIPQVHKVSKPAKQKAMGQCCHRCGKAGHTAPNCRFKDSKCYQCGKKGHLRSVCRSKQDGKRQPAHRAVQFVQEDDVCPLYKIRGSSQTPPLRVSVEIDNQVVDMEVDTGAACSLMSEVSFRQLWPSRKLSKAGLRLCTYSGEPIPVLGTLTVNVKYKEQVYKEPLLVVKGDGPDLFGRNWLDHIRLDWQEIKYLQQSPLQSVLKGHEAVFHGGLGALKGYQATIVVDPNARPRFWKARSVPYAYRGLVEEELNRLVQEGILEPVEMSDWASPIVPVLKSDGKSVRVCGDFKQTVNPVCKLDRYPIPRIEDLFATLRGGKVFSKLDLSQAYQQIPLDEESKKFVVINTQKGLFRYTRLPYGISSAPGIFQRVMEGLLQGIEGVIVYIDDVLVSGATADEHLKRLEEVLSRLEKAGLCLQKSKCHFMVSSVTFLGHKVDKDGLHPLPDKISAVLSAPTPRNLQELKSYLGLLSYYSKFLPKLSTVLAPLYRLLRKDTHWRWMAAEEKAFDLSKELLTSSRLLVHFDPSLPLILACDASDYGVGAVLAHRMPNGEERPIGYASRSLSKAERNYPQLEKEALACIFGVKRFHSYLFGHHFHLITDHKPLLALLNEHRSTSPQASARIRRWSLFLSSYEYSLSFRDTQSHSNADALSRLPLPIAPEEEDPPPEVILLMKHLAESPVTSRDICRGTQQDPVLSSVLRNVRQGWSNSPDSALSPFYSRRYELSVQDGCLLWGSRVIVPPSGRKAVLNELHEAHPGISRMKALARMYVWWPGLDKDIEESVRLCRECQVNQASPPVAPLHPWQWPSRPWSRLHIDYAGPICGRMILLVVDAHSKWIEAFTVSTASSATTIERLRQVFAQFGLPKTVVSDNAAYFTSQEFESYLELNAIRHTKSSPYHPSSNGLVERAVQSLKNGLKKVTEGTLEARIAKILFQYRITPHSTTGIAPAELLLRARPRSRMDALFPNTADRVQAKQEQQKNTHDTTAHNRSFSVGQSVLV